MKLDIVTGLGVAGAISAMVGLYWWWRTILVAVAIVGVGAILYWRWLAVEPSVTTAETERPASTPTDLPVPAAKAAAATTDMDIEWNVGTHHLEEMKRAFESGGVEECITLLETSRDDWKQLSLNVAVIGNSGVGKSSFINAIRRLTADDEGAAAVGVKETTAEIRSYTQPGNHRLKFWDLPGVGTDRFPRETYLSDIQVDEYDFFLLITATRFTQDDTWLGGEFYKRNKNYFFVRTKVGLDIYNDTEAHPRTHNADKVLEVIRESTQEHLNKNGCVDVPVFLIDSYKPMEFDFQPLEQRLIKDFPEMKRAALVLSLQSTSKEMIHLKVAELRSRLWKLAGLSALGAAIPVPIVSIAMDLAMVVGESEFYFEQLGLDETSLKKYARLSNTDYRDLQSIVDNSLGFRLGGMRALVEIIIKGGSVFISAVAEEGCRYVPLIGSFIAAPLSFGATYGSLKLVLDKFESVALKVVQFATESAVAIEESDDD